MADTQTATPAPAAPPPSMGDTAAGISALTKQYQPQLQAADQATLDYMKQGAADRAPISADVQAQQQLLSQALAKPPTPEKTPDSPDLKFKKVSLGALVGTVVAGLIMGRAAKTGPMLTAAGSLNALVAAHNSGEQDRIAAAKEDYDEKLKAVDRHNQDMRQQFSDITDLMKTNVTMAKDRLDMFNAQYTDGLNQHFQQAKSLQGAYKVALDGMTSQLNAQDQLERVADQHEHLAIDRKTLELNQQKAAKEGWEPYVDKGNNNKPFRWNAETNEMQDLDGKPYKAINPSKVPSGAGGASAVSQRFNNRIVSAAALATNDAVNLMQMPMTASSGLLGGTHTGSMFDATKTALAQKMTPQNDQVYKVMATGIQRNLSQIESAGLAPSGSLTAQMETAIANPGDDGITKLHRFAQIRQIVDTGMDALLSDPTVSDQQRQYAQKLTERIDKAIPFTHEDLINFSSAAKDDETFSQYAKRTLGKDVKLPAAVPHDWLDRARTANPDYTDEELMESWEAKHGGK